MPAPSVQTMTHVEQWQWFLAMRRATLFAGWMMPEHGTQARYDHKCKCQPCRTAHTVYTRPYKVAFAERQRKQKEAATSPTR